MVDQLTPSQLGGADYAQQLLIAHPNFQTFRHPCKGSRLSDFQGRFRILLNKLLAYCSRFVHLLTVFILISQQQQSCRAGGTKQGGGGGVEIPLQILAELEAKLVPSKGFVLILVKTRNQFNLRSP